MLIILNIQKLSPVLFIDIKYCVSIGENIIFLKSKKHDVIIKCEVECKIK